MRDIVIENNNNSLGFFYGFEFTDEVGTIEYDWSTTYFEQALCDGCGEFVEDEYVYIIKALKSAKLIPADFKLLCCVCYWKKIKKKEKENE